VPGAEPAPRCQKGKYNPQPVETPFETLLILAVSYRNRADGNPVLINREVSGSDGTGRLQTSRNTRYFAGIYSLCPMPGKSNLLPLSKFVIFES